MLKQLYVPPMRRLADGRARRLKLGVRRWIRERSVHVAASVLLVSIWVTAHIYYYNYLKALEFGVHVSAAQVEVQQTRRHRVQQNLTRIVAQYSAYEDKLLTTLTAIRASGQGGGGAPAVQRPLGLHGANDPGAMPPAVSSALPPLASGLAPVLSASGQPALATGLPAAPSASGSVAVVAPPPAGHDNAGVGASSPTAAAPPPVAAAPLPGFPRADGSHTVPPSLEELLTRLRVVAEQYPELQLGTSLQQLATAIVELETEIAKRIMTYNEAVNNYITVVETFPGIIFARVSGFPRYQFYPIDQQQKGYREVAF
jgi:hypothetical protein